MPEYRGSSTASTPTGAASTPRRGPGEELARKCIYVEQGRSSKTGARQRPLFEQMKRDAAARKFDRLLVWKVSRLDLDVREVISTVYELADVGITVIPVKSATGPISSTIGKLLWAIQAWYAEMKNPRDRRPSKPVKSERGRRAGTWAGRPRFFGGMKSASSAALAIAGPRSPLGWGSAHERRGGFTLPCPRPPGPGESIEDNSHAEPRSESISRSRG